VREGDLEAIHGVEIGISFKLLFLIIWILFPTNMVKLLFLSIVLVVGTDGKTLVWCQLTRIYIYFSCS
jgi:hypothetical protein